MAKSLVSFFKAIMSGTFSSPIVVDEAASPVKILYGEQYRLVGKKLATSKIRYQCYGYLTNHRYG